MHFSMFCRDLRPLRNPEGPQKDHVEVEYRSLSVLTTYKRVCDDPFVDGGSRRFEDSVGVQC